MVVDAAVVAGTAAVVVPVDSAVAGDDTSAATTTTAAVGQLAGFARRDVVVGGDTWTVAVAATSQQRARGLMFVTDLGDVDGMLFVFPEESTGGFWMKNTFIPLDIAFFGADGSLVDLLSMIPCEEDPCPVYTPSGQYRYALETVPGRFDEVLGELALVP